MAARKWATSKAGIVTSLIVWTTLTVLAAARFVVASDATGRWLAGVSVVLGCGLAASYAIKLEQLRHGDAHPSQ